MSLVSKVQDAVDQVLQEWQDEEKVFTAHDVKMEVRDRGFWVFHDPCRDYVHAKYENGDLYYNYQRTPAYLRTGNGKMYIQVFHPAGVDPMTHPKAVSMTCMQPAPQVVSSRKSNDNVVQVDAKNRVRVPVAVTSSLGWKEGTTVHVQERNGELRIVEVDDNDFMSLFPKTHTVDCYGNIRITLSDPRSTEYKVQVEVGGNASKNTDAVVVNPS